MTTENYNSFVREALKLLQDDNRWGSTSPKQINNSPIKIKNFDIDTDEKVMPTYQEPVARQFITEHTKCKCLKSRCQKQYCDCFAAGKACSIDCNCIGCNNMNHSQNKKIILGCNCKKTGCTKKYCECYVKKSKCTFMCNCVDCCNQEDSDSEKENQKSKIIVLGILSQNLWQNAQIIQKYNK